MIRNRILWVFVLIVTLVGAWFFGERALYMAAIVLVILPVASCIVSFLLFMRLKVTHKQPFTVSKNTPATLIVTVHNHTFMPLGRVGVTLDYDADAINLSQNATISISPYGMNRLEIPFEVEFRGIYPLGVESVQLTDISGLFTFTRKINAAKTITCLPGIGSLPHFSLTMRLASQESSRHDIRDEDYSTISDIRPYLPTDSIKRVHWKLTAKRNEWLVKNFQSNARNTVTVIIDTVRLPLAPRQSYALEDSIVESSLGLVKYCLGNAMPINFLTTEGYEVEASGGGEFEAVYNAASEIVFTEKPVLDCRTVLAQKLNDANGYVNIVILTAQLTPQLYERVLNGTNNGHCIAVVFFEPPEADEKTLEIFKLLSEGRMPCFRVDPYAGDDSAHS